MLVQACSKYFAIPLWANIQEGLTLFTKSGDGEPLSKTVRVVEMAKQVAWAMGTPAYLVLDAYFAVGPVFLAAAAELNGMQDFIHILTRAKKNVVAYHDPPKKKKHQRGRPREYGQKVKLMNLFDSKAKRYTFQKAPANIYGQSENVRYLVLNLLWRPVKSKLRFILAESSRGRIILMTSDLNLNPVTAIQLYCRRVTIETLFDTLKNTLGGMAYHFWSQHLSPASRRPRKKTDQKQSSSNLIQTQNTLTAIEKFVNVQLLVVGTLQLIAKQFPQKVKNKANCWLRTVSSNTPSEFVTRTALANILKNNLYGFAKDWITQLIRQKQKSCKNKGSNKKTA
jgi:hypothetical protein